jgi:DNA-binding NarL/FixJ family response regulator
MHIALILDDLPESRDWLVRVMHESFPGVQTHAVGSLREARDWLRRGVTPDIALIDLGLPDGSGVELIAELNRSAPACLCIVASIYDDDRHIFPALRAGAHGYILKDQSRDDIVPLLQGIAAGQPPLSPAIARKILSSFRPALTDEEPVVLTPRETEVLTLIAKGMTLAETAALLGITRHTVDGYVKDIYRKLNVSSRAEAALSAQRMGLV